MTTSEMGRFTSMPLPRQPMASPQCFNMKPMTIQQEAIMSAHKTDCSEENARLRQDWQVKCLARKIIGDRPDGPKITGE